MGYSVVGKLEAKFKTTFPIVYFLLHKDCLPTDADKEKNDFKCWCPYCERTFEYYAKFVRHHDIDVTDNRKYYKNWVTALHEWDDGKAMFVKRNTWKDRPKGETKRLLNGRRNEPIRQNWSPDRGSNNFKFTPPSTNKRKDDISFQKGTSVQPTQKTSSEPFQKEKNNQTLAAPSSDQSLQFTPFANLLPTNQQPRITGQNMIREYGTKPSQITDAYGAADKPTMNLTKKPPSPEKPLDLRAKKAENPDLGQGDGQWKKKGMNKTEIDTTVNEAEEEEVSDTQCKTY